MCAMSTYCARCTAHSLAACRCSKCRRRRICRSCRRTILPNHSLTPAAMSALASKININNLLLSRTHLYHSASCESMARTHARDQLRQCRRLISWKRSRVSILQCCPLLGLVVNNNNNNDDDNNHAALWCAQDSRSHVDCCAYSAAMR